MSASRSDRHLRRGQGQLEFARLTALETDECVLWPYAKAKGYGTLTVNGRHRATHVLACEHHHGAAPAGRPHALHSCRNKNCMNYRHLRWGTPGENQDDRVRDGTDSRGERQGASRLTQAQVLAIREAYQTGGVRQKDLAAEYGVSRGAIGSIVTRKNWAWL